MLATGVVLYLSLSRTLMLTLDAQLEAAGQSARMELIESGGIGDLQRDGYQAGVLYVVLASDGSVVANPQQVDVQALPAGLLTTQSPAFETASIGGDAIRLYGQQVVEPGGDWVTLIVGQSLAPEYAAAQQLLLTLGVCGAVGVLFSFAGAWFLAARALVPIKRAFRTSAGVRGGRVARAAYPLDDPPLGGGLARQRTGATQSGAGVRDSRGNRSHGAPDA